MKTISIYLIKLYQTILSPIFGPSCRFYPTCSNYAVDAINNHGILKGFLLSIKRILKCHPFNPGGVDYVPEAIPIKRREI